MGKSEDELRGKRLGSEIARNNIVFWIMELQHRHDEAKDQMVHEDDYQLGYLHGLTTAIGFLEDRLDHIYKHDKMIEDLWKEMYGDD